MVRQVLNWICTPIIFHWATNVKFIFLPKKWFPFPMITNLIYELLALMETCPVANRSTVLLDLIYSCLCMLYESECLRERIGIDLISPSMKTNPESPVGHPCTLFSLGHLIQTSKNFSPSCLYLWELLCLVPYTRSLQFGQILKEWRLVWCLDSADMKFCSTPCTLIDHASALKTVSF